VRARSYKTLADIAITVLFAMPRDVTMVCGPITSGGLGMLALNLDRFCFAIDLLAASGENVFTQLPFERSVRAIREFKHYNVKNDRLLQKFYLPIFRSGFVTRLCFLPLWKTSYGATWEHERAIELGIGRAYFIQGFESFPSGTKIFD